MKSIPIIDVGGLVNNSPDKKEAAKQIGLACQKYGFFYVINHGVDEKLQERLELLSKKFYALPLDVKNKINMKNQKGRALHGYFPYGAEITSGKTDIKEGIYFGNEIDSNHPYYDADLPFYGSNLFPDDEIPELRNAVIEYMKQVEYLGHKIMEGIALSLGLEGDYFYKRYTSKPMQSLGIINYLPVNIDLNKGEEMWGVGEHTDYGLLTILRQDKSGGLQVKSHSEWIDAPPIDNSFVCNIGDMLDRMTGGIYKSTPHRVKVQTRANRLSFPYFFCPDYYAEVKKIEGITTVIEDKDERWDKQSVHEFTENFGDYMLKKVLKALPQQQTKVIS